MTRPSADRVKALWTGTGTGTISLGPAVTGEPVQAFPAALDGHIVRYLIKHATAMEAEAGYGVYTLFGATLSRLYRFYPTVGGSAVNFSSGDKFVSITASTVDLVVDEAATDPTVTSDINNGFLKGNLRLNTASDAVFFCAHHAAGVARWRRLDGAGVTLDQNDILARIAAGSGDGTGIAAADLAEVTPVAGDKILGWQGGTGLRKFDVVGWPGTGDAAPTLVSKTGTSTLASTERLHQNIIVTSGATNVVFEVPLSAAANSEWRIMPRHTGCTVTKAAGAGSITPTPARIINGGLVIVTVITNVGSTPVIEVRGEVIVPSTSVAGKTYGQDDHGQDFTATGTQVFGAAATFGNGFYVNIWNTAAASIIIDGVDANHTLPVNGVCTVKKRGDGALVCNGSGGDTLLDAA